MAFRVLHELHGRRRSRNMGVGLALGTLILLIFALTLVKVQSLGPGSLEGYDHQPRTGLTEGGS